MGQIIHLISIKIEQNSIKDINPITNIRIFITICIKFKLRPIY